MPKLAFPGGALIGCAAGFMNVPRIKGSHNAMKTGMLAAEAAFAALGAGRANDVLEAYETAYRASHVYKDLKRVRNVKPLWSKLGTFLGVPLGGLDMWTNQLFGLCLFGTLKHGKPDYATLKHASECKPIAYPKPDGIISFDKLSSVFLSNTNHEEDQPVHLVLKDPSIPIRVNLPEYRRTGAALLPGRRLRSRPGTKRPAVPDQCPELRSLQNLRHQGSGAEHHLGHARRRRWTQLLQHVRRLALRINPFILAAVISAALSGCVNARVSTSPVDRDSNDMPGYGAYLSGRFAAGEHNMSDAARYYGESLEHDPTDSTLLALTFFYATSAGDIDTAAKLAERLTAATPDDRASRLVLAIAALKHKDYKEARGRRSANRRRGRSRR